MKNYILLIPILFIALIISVFLGIDMTYSHSQLQISPIIQDGDLIRSSTKTYSHNTYDVYIVKDKNGFKFKRLILNERIFESYGHFGWEDIKNVDPAVLDMYETSALVQYYNEFGEVADNRIFSLYENPDGDTGIKRHLDISAQDFEACFDAASVFSMNWIEAGEDFYITQAPLTNGELEYCNDTGMGGIGGDSEVSGFDIHVPTDNTETNQDNIEGLVTTGTGQNPSTTSQDNSEQGIREQVPTPISTENQDDVEDLGTPDTVQVSAQIIGNVPKDYTTGAILEWTGGTLYQIKARLQTLGCTVDVINVYDQAKDTWFEYSQYSSPHEENQEFHNNFPNDYIPPTDIQIPNCYDMCYFQYAPEALDGATTYKNRVLIQSNIDRARNGCKSPESIYTGSQFEGIPCNQDWDPRTIEYVFPIMPVMKDLCIFRTDSQTVFAAGQHFGMTANDGGGYSIKNIWLSNRKPSIVVHGYGNVEFQFYVELHEICHSQQEWYVAQLMSTYDLYVEEKTFGYQLWHRTPAGKALIDLAKFEHVFGFNDEGVPIHAYWELGSGSLYHNVYNTDPVELAAELCAIKLYLDITGATTMDFKRGYSRETIQHANQWLNEYVFVLE